VLYQAELRPPCGEWARHSPKRGGSAPGRTRTPNLRIRSPLLYPVELQGLGTLTRPVGGGPFERVKGIEPSPPAWKAGALPLSYTRVLVIVNGWSGWSDLNRRPRAPKARALPNCATARFAGKATCRPIPVPVLTYVRRMELETEVLERVRTYESSSRWERRELGRDLRRLGLSYGEIVELIPVKKSTLATWCRDVALTPEQVEAIRVRRAPEPGIPRDTQRRRRREVELIRAQASLEAEHLVKNSFWVAGVTLYWG
jgi:hypothetical protein